MRFKERERRKKCKKAHTNFRIRAYGRTELAQLYNPHLAPSTAWHRLRAWIDRCPGLAGQLAASGYNGSQRTWTPAQVRLIVEALGEP